MQLTHRHWRFYPGDIPSGAARFLLLGRLGLNSTKASISLYAFTSRGRIFSRAGPYQEEHTVAGLTPCTPTVNP
jgi:hypothetical protein